jgi:ABC-type branched-subunit amino acid transport system ATPase component
VVARPNLLCLDEPAAGLGDDEIDALAAVLRRLAGMGFAILLIEHNLSFVRSISDSIISLESGRVVDELTPSYSADASDLGRAANVKRTPNLEAEPVLKVTELSAWYGEARALFDVSLSVQPGEVVGVLGDNGAGKSTLLRSIARLHRKTRGSVCFEGHEIIGRSSQELSTLGVGLVREGAIVFPDMTVAEHLTLARRLAERRHQPWRGEEAVYEWLPILGERRQTKAGLLSGGQRQLLALASAAIASPTCLLLDEPSAGLAESILETVFDFVRRIAADGVTLVIAEQSERWIADIADQIYWLEVGRMAQVGDSPLQPT